MAPGDSTATIKYKEFENTNDRVTQATYLPGTFPLESISRENFQRFVV